MSAHKKYVVWFHEVDKHDIPMVGGKGANLGEMTQAHLPVPPGFIVTAHAYYTFLEQEHLRPKIERLLKNIDHNDSQALQKAARDIQHLIKHADIPKDIVQSIIRHYFALSEADLEAKKIPALLMQFKKITASHLLHVAVRSSATAEDLPKASFAGQQATYLNIKGEANLINAVRAAWASLFTARAMFYRKEHGFDDFKVGIAIPVQKMVQSDASGVMFTIDPVTNDKAKITIEAIYGLGELIVQGAVTPDHYEVDKKDLTIVQKIINRQTEYLPGIGKREAPVLQAFQKKQKITDEQIIEFAKLGKRLEHHYYFPQDIEWALEDDKLYIVQTRPITTMQETEGIQEKTTDYMKKLIKLVTGSGASPGVASGTVQIIKNASQIHKISAGEILVAEQTNPDYVPAMKKAVAIVTAKGGRTSHAAIVSRELGTPAVVGADRAMSILKDGMAITVDGGTGIVYKGVLPAALQKRPRLSTANENIKTATKIYVNLAEVERAEEVAKLHVDGVGLLRAEFMLAGIGVHPKWIIAQKKQKSYISELSEKIAVFCRVFGSDRPVVYRTTDFKTNEYKNLKHGAGFEENEENPMLGYRGAARYVQDVEVFELELAAIKLVRQKMGHKNLHVMIPFVRSPGQLLETKKIMAGMGLLRTPSFKIWMMVELPVNVISIEEFLKIGIDGVSIGSNDLTQLILGVDRDNGKIAQYFNELDPAVQWALEKTVKTAHKFGVTSSLCGQAASDYPELVEKLVEWGITSVSVNADAVDKVRGIVAEAEKRKIKK